jgi:hypothetical protein
MHERLIDGSNPDSDPALLVDIGGGYGHDLLAFHQKYPNKGKLLLQDLPSVVAQKRGFPEGIEAMGYDFFTEQPVKGKPTLQVLKQQTWHYSKVLWLTFLSLTIQVLEATFTIISYTTGATISAKRS